MMKQRPKIFINIMLILATVCILVLCFALPILATQMQDNLIKSQADSVPIAATTLSTTSDDSPAELLRFSMYGYETVDYEIEASAQDAISKQQVTAELLQLFEKNGASLLDDNQIVRQTTVPYLAKSASMNSVRLLWECTVQDASDNFAYFTIDDSTNLMLSFSVYSSNQASSVAITAPFANNYYDEPSDESVDRSWSEPLPEEWSSENQIMTDEYYVPQYWQDIEVPIEILKKYYGFSVVDINYSEPEARWDGFNIVSGNIVFTSADAGDIVCAFYAEMGTYIIFEFNIP